VAADEQKPCIQISNISHPLQWTKSKLKSTTLNETQHKHTAVLIQEDTDQESKPTTLEATTPTVVEAALAEVLADEAVADALTTVVAAAAALAEAQDFGKIKEETAQHYNAGSAAVPTDLVTAQLQRPKNAFVFTSSDLAHETLGQALMLDANVNDMITIAPTKLDYHSVVCDLLMNKQMAAHTTRI
jgi:hypothetical protein